jgi:hypothetical protein
MNLRIRLRTLAVTASLLAASILCAGWKWDGPPHF